MIEHLDEDGYFSVAIHAPDCPSLSTTVHRLESPHALARRASQMLLPIRPHVTVQACWPIEHPRDPEHVLHLLLSFDQPQCPDSTMFLIDCRGIMGRTQDFVAFAARRELTAGELLALIHEHTNGISPPAFVLVNNKPLSDLGMRRYSLPLVRLLTRQQYVAWQRDPERHCPATWPTSLLLRHLPCFQALSETFEAFLQRRFGYFRGRDQAASELALHSPSNPAHGLQENSTSEEEPTAAGTTTTTTTVGEVCWRNDTQGLTTSTTTSGELPGNAHPFGTLQTGVLQVHLFSHCGDILTSTVRTEDLAEVLLFKMCRSLLQHQCLAAGEDLVTCPRVHFSEQGPHLFLHTCRPESSARCWIFAPQWLDCPLAIRCGTGWSRAAFFRAIGLQDLPGATVTVAGRVLSSSVVPRHGDVVVVHSAALAVHSAPLLTLLSRIPDIQALLFRLAGPDLTVAVDENQHRQYWQIAVRRCQRCFGLHRPGVRVTVASSDMPCLVICLGTLITPSLAQVQEFFRRFLADKFGQRSTQRYSAA